MESTSGEAAGKRHSRHGSSGRATIARRPTRGPLDVDDSPLSPSPLSQSSTPTVSTPPAPPLIPTTSSLLSTSQSQYQTPRLPSPSIPSDLSKLTLSTDQSFRTARTSSPVPPPVPEPAAVSQKDFSYLLNPQIYHPLSHLDIPPPFRSLSNHSFSATTTIQELLRNGQFRAAAILAANKLTALPPNNPSPYDHSTIFSLIYTRLSCLTLCNQTTLAAQEVKALEDLNSAFYREGDEGTGKHLVPWELRVLAVRLQGMGFNDVRRGVMGFYDLARDVRLTVSQLKKDLIDLEDGKQKQAKVGEIKVWEGRLQDLGIRVANALIEMEDLEGARCFLSTLKSDPDRDDLSLQKALLYLTLGQSDTARACISQDTTEASQVEDEKRTILALAHMADATYDAAIQAWESLIASNHSPQNLALYKQNLAVALLYSGKMQDARTTLESLISTPSNSNTPSDSFHALTFNLCTIYELCSERSRALKLGLAEKIAGMAVRDAKQSAQKDINQSGSGNGNGSGNEKVWGAEKVNGNFKL